MSKSWQNTRQGVVTMLAPSRGASLETPRRHPALRGPSTVTTHHAPSRGPSAETPRRHLASRGHSCLLYTSDAADE